MLRGLLVLTLLIVVTVLGLPLYLAGLGSVPLPEPERAQGDLPIRVYLHEEDRLTAMPLEEYVKGVVAAEMPASFPIEALKAQAVVARTYAVRRMRVFGGPGCDRHPAADVCTEPTTHQAFATEESLRRRWGALRYAAYWQRIEQAVEATRGLILMYDGRPIDAVYHSTSGGRTEAAEYVWGQPVPYLTSVPSPYEERSPRARQTVHLSWTELGRLLGLESTSVAAAGTSPGTVLEALDRTPSGRITRLRVGTTILDAPEIRQRLHLNSTWFSWETDADGVTFTVRGYGHGVGMSQYGADGMARRGSTYEAILAHYYPGTDLRPIFVE
ncbi:MAG TPA: stage II sporulation protein D [Bacillota bacterium]